MTATPQQLLCVTFAALSGRSPQFALACLRPCPNPCSGQTLQALLVQALAASFLQSFLHVRVSRAQCLGCCCATFQLIGASGQQLQQPMKWPSCHWLEHCNQVRTPVRWHRGLNGVRATCSVACAFLACFCGASHFGKPQSSPVNSCSEQLTLTSSIFSTVASPALQSGPAGCAGMHPRAQCEAQLWAQSTLKPKFKTVPMGLSPLAHAQPRHPEVDWHSFEVWLGKH